ncbi:hypothetical protein DY000_02038771 [Brassica cretica]|uniref:Uncharacterized protein n=1 Tax=Brassica cretica TaxID=69181 RepID=A0ABQ7BK41_BRACR|nr:hypothetical protein DY000_02038771 [Brassica cretica]
MVKLYKLFEPKESVAAESSRAEDDLSPAQLAELSKSLRELKLILYGNNSEAEPVAEACAQLTLEFFKDATQVVANLQRQQVNSRLVAADYLETNTDLMDVLVDDFENTVTLCFLQTSTQSFLNQCVNFLQLLGDILLDRSNSVVMKKYVSSMDNLRILMNLLRESSKTIQIEAFHVSSKPKEALRHLNVLVANRNKLLRLLADLKLDKEDESFEADKAHVVSEIASLKPRDLA